MYKSESKAYTKSTARLVSEFAKMPGIGIKTAERLAMYVLGLSPEEALALADAVRDVKANTKFCKKCFNFTEAQNNDSDLCAICSNPKRDQSTICVVEYPADLIALEKTGTFNGLYHVLMGHISPIDGIEPEDLKINQLIERIKDGQVKEVIMAVNPNMEGDSTILFLGDLLRPLGVKITRLARGLPAGTEILLTSKNILHEALVSRQEI